MDIEFNTKRLAKQCNSRKAMAAQWDPEMAKKLQRRLNDLEAANCLEDLRHAPGMYHELKGNRAGEIAVRLRGPYRLIFRPNHEPVPITPDSKIDWAQVSKILITEVVDYH